MAYMYEYDRTDSEPGGSPALDRQLLDQLLGAGRQPLIDPAAVAQVDLRLRGMGKPPRTATEMAEWLRRLGDLAAEDLRGPMAGFLNELEADGRASQIELPGSRQRWVLTEEANLYHEAFGMSAAPPNRQSAAAETILQRYLETHALVGLTDLLTRYPFERDWASRKLEQWAESGRAVAVSTSESEATRYAAPPNLDQVQRSTLALLRREVLTCPPTQFADFLLRWQGVHPESRGSGSEGLSAVLDRLEGLPVPAELWEHAVLPARLPDYQPHWLDEACAGGQWVWTGHGGDAGAGAVAFWRREHLVELPPPAASAADSGPSAQVLECLRARGALFVPDLASQTGLNPSAVRLSLWELVRQGWVSNDRFDVVRKGEQTPPPPRTAVNARSLMRGRGRPPAAPEARWSLMSWGQPEVAEHALLQTKVLLKRYGIAARELAILDPAMLPWRILYEVLSRLEMTGEVRRGFFVESLSGAQFALPDAAQMLQSLALPSHAGAPAILLHSQDPANLYGSGAPLDILLLDGGTRPLLRRAGNWLVLRAGRPVLIVEQAGKRLTTLASASQEDQAAAVALLPGILGRNGQHKLTVEEWNGQAVAGSAGRELLESAGFVRDYQAMTLYAAWR
jgi:ATP-dependent Lhr-like helicase